MTDSRVDGSRLTPDERRRYADDGYFVRERVFSATEVDNLCAAAERSAACAKQLSRAGTTYYLDGHRFVDVGHRTIQFEHAYGSETVRVIEPVHDLDAEWEHLIDDPRITVPVQGLLGHAPIALWTDKLNLKRPREGSGFRWHQDSPYWVHDCVHVDALPNVYVALDDATEANGCLCVIAGSHVEGCLPGTADGSQLGGFFTHPGSIDESRQVPLVVPAGSLAFFDPHTIHGSAPNASDRPRRAVVLTYQPAGHPMLKLKQVRNVPRGDHV